MEIKENTPLYYKDKKIGIVTKVNEKDNVIIGNICVNDNNDLFSGKEISVGYKINYSNENPNYDDFKQLYLTEPKPNENIKVCNDCKFFKDGCTVSYLENKYGNKNTPACTDFIGR